MAWWRMRKFFLPLANKVWGKLMFLNVSVILSTGGGGWLPSMYHWSHDRGVCIHGRVCIQGRLCIQGVCIWGGGRPHPIGRHGELGRSLTKIQAILWIRSTNGWYASYWMHSCCISYLNHLNPVQGCFFYLSIKLSPAQQSATVLKIRDGCFLKY